MYQKNKTSEKSETLFFSEQIIKTCIVDYTFLIQYNGEGFFH